MPTTQISLVITKKIFQLIDVSTFGLRKKCFPMPIIARSGNGARGYITMFANGKQAISNYQEDAKIIQNCRGEAWTAKTNNTQSGGKHTIYSTTDKPTIVSIRYFKDLRSWLKPWQNTIIIGDNNNLKSPLQ